MTTTISFPTTLALYERHERIRNAMREIGVAKIHSVRLQVEGAEDVPVENDADIMAATTATITHR